VRLIPITNELLPRARAYIRPAGRAIVGSELVESLVKSTCHYLLKRIENNSQAGEVGANTYSCNYIEIANLLLTANRQLSYFTRK
jgi:hypothetical protein